MEDIHYVLTRDFSYYRKLSPEAKEKFVKRVNDFVEGRIFEGRKGFEVTENVKILISATAIQLTFGHVYYHLEAFKRIIIYPERFYSKYDDKYHFGETHTMGVVVLSWKDFYIGIKNDNDARNVGLHEFAHALMVSDIKGEYVDDYFSDYLEKWLVAGNAFLKKDKTSDKHFFREYAVTNIHELFAVGVEYFFEMPEEFYRNEKDFYRIFCLLLRQNPRKKDSHFSYNEIFENQDSEYIYLRENPSRSNYKVRDNSLSVIMSLIGLAFVLFVPFPLWLKLLFGLPLVYYAGSRIFNFAIHEKYVNVNSEYLFAVLNGAPDKSNMTDLIISLNIEDGGEQEDWMRIIHADFDTVDSHSFTYYGDLNDLFYRAYHNYKIATFKHGKRFIPKKS